MSIKCEFQNDILKDNLDPKIIEFTNCLKSWEHRKLSLITVIKTLALPKLVYPLTVLPTPPDAVIDLIKTKCVGLRKSLSVQRAKITILKIKLHN